MAHIAISIVMFQNNREMLERAIRSALAVSDGADQFRMVLVDNSPTDALKSLTAIDPRIEYDFVDANIGFGAGHNRGIKRFEEWSDAHLFLNPDVQFGADVLPGLMRYLETHPQTGLCMPKIIYPDGSLQPACKLLPTPTQLLLRRLPLVKTFTEQGNWLYEMRGADHSKEMNVPFLSGCFMFARTKTLAQTGGFDERYFMYQEDTDLSRRVHEVAQTMYVPQFTVQHEAQYGSRKNRRLMKIHIKSAIAYFNKWGWVFDRRRSEINAKAIAAYRLGERPPANTSISPNR